MKSNNIDPSNNHLFMSPDGSTLARCGDDGETPPLYVSLDDGQTWTQKGNICPERVLDGGKMIAIDGTPSVVKRSDDYGLTWTSAGTHAVYDTTLMSISTNGNSLFDGHKISLDGGASWASIPAEVPTQKVDDYIMQTGVSNDGKKLITSKAPYGEFKGFKLVKREKALTDEKLANRVPYKLPVYVLGNNKKKVNNVTLKFISPRETFEAKVVDGWVDLSLLEDNNYVMEVVKGNYAIDAFPLTVKDKSEFGAKKYVFNHLSCGSVQALYLINKKQAHKNDTTLVSSDGTTKVTGFRFGNGEYALSSRVLKNVKVPELKGKNYLVLDVDTVNMYRVELSPLAYGNFKITTTVAGKKPVKNVYYIDGANKLQKVKFTQKGDKLTFNMDSMARYNTVIEYK